MVEIHLVLDELDDGHDEVGVAQPAEHVVEAAHVLVLHAPGDAMREGGEHHAGYLGEALLDGAGHGEGIVVGIAGHTDDEVDVGRLQHVLSLLDGRHLGEGGRIAQSELDIFVIDFLLNAAIVLEHKGIVGIGDNEYVVYATPHQVDERHVLKIKVAPLIG